VPYISGAPIKKAKNRPNRGTLLTSFLEEHPLTSTPPNTINPTHEDDLTPTLESKVNDEGKSNISETYKME
jgi:hypothetical protein